MHLKNNIVIAVDGYAGSGKSSICKAMAQRLNIIHINSGLIYRAITLYMYNNNIDFNNVDAIKSRLNDVDVNIAYNKEKGKNIVFLNNEKVNKYLREQYIEQNVSRISKIKEVRDKVLKIQRALSANSSIIMDGRDICTKVFPDADIKLFITADLEVRAIRKFKDYEGNSNITLDQIRNEIRQRDIDDETREESPLRKADDAIEIDNSVLPLDEQVDRIIKIVNDKLHIKG